MKTKNFILKYLTFLFLFNIFFLNHNSFSENIKKFDIQGNDRVSDNTIIIFSNLNIGEKITTENLNRALKELYYTDYFKDISIGHKNGIVEIKVIENPIIQSVEINGIDSNRIYENLKEVTMKIEKYPFVENKISQQVILIQNILKSNGYYFVNLEPSIKNNDNNTVDLVYNIDLGEVAKIKKISFIGDRVFRDNTLRNVILSEENKFWKFLTSNKFLDTNRINTDIIRLKKYYQNRGYFDIKIKSATALITDENQFELIFNINSGNKFFFNNIQILNKENYEIENIEIFEKKLKKLEGKEYSKKKIDSLIDELNEYILQNNFIFVNAKYKEIINEQDKININISLDELEKQYVNRINIFGNFITDEKVIRNEFIVDEGDAFNDVLFNKSISKIKARNIFKSVNYSINNETDISKNIDIIIEEKATGEISAGAGTGTTGSSLNAGIKENNYLGLGIKLDANAIISDDSLKGRFSVINPNYNNSDKSIKTIIENTTNDFMSTSGYKTNRTGFIFGTEFEQKTNLFVNLELSNYYEDLKTSSTANNLLRNQEGTYFENLITYSLKYNRLNQDYQPTDGYINNFSQTLPLISDDKSIENSFTSSIYHSLSDNLILSANLYLKTINSIDDDVRISKRVFVPGRKLRGFESGKIGPKDGNQFIGGNYASALNLNSTLPNVLFENENIDVNFFIDLANVWEVDYNSSIDSNKIRSSTGVAVNWFSGIGPLTFSYAIPLSEADTDITERFRFQIGTSF